MNPTVNGIIPPAIGKLRITVVYDNNPYKEGFTTSWGFACVIEGAEKTILFDTGGDSTVLLNNMQQSGIDPKEIDVVVLSHTHGDHIGGLDGLLKANPDVTVYFPATFPMRFGGSLTYAGIKTVEVNDPAAICKDVYFNRSSGELDERTGLDDFHRQGGDCDYRLCPSGDCNLLKTVKELNADNILLVMGGFSFGAIRKQKLEEIIVTFRKLGVQQVGPCHCTGELARQTFKQEYGKDFLDVGVGRLIRFD